MTTPLYLRALVAGAAFAVVPAVATPRTEALTDLSLEQLANIVVTSVSRREQPLATAAASVYVITGDEIRRAGVRTLPEALRLAPNLQVARADANQYAISARGFGNVLANKMLVAIDGRIVYSPLFSGVFWEAQDAMLEDVERIEVIDGPVATVWGTNAVNGMINVVTRPAAETQGTLLSAGYGNREQLASGRYGGALPNGGHWRGYARLVEIDESSLASGNGAMDASRRRQAGFRSDWEDGRDGYTLQGDAYDVDVDQLPSARNARGANVLGRWTRALGGGDQLTVQAYYDHTSRRHPGTFEEHLNTADVEAQANVRVLDAHRLLVGAGYRYQRDDVTNFPSQAFLPEDRVLATSYLLAQDDVDLAPTVGLIAGVKLEHNRYTGLEWLPTLRVRWNPVADTLLWAAATRAVRAPSRIDREYFLPGVPPYFVQGGPGFRSEISNVLEVGVRGQPSPRASYAATAFYHDQQRQRSLEPIPGGAQVRNGIEGSTSGVTAWMTWHPLDRIRLMAGGTWLVQGLDAAPGVVDIGGLAGLGNDPRVSAVARASFDFTDRHEADVVVRHVGARPNPAVPAYTAVDLRLGWRVSPSVELSVTLDNALDGQHVEWGPASNRVEFGRAWFVKVVARL